MSGEGFHLKIRNKFLKLDLVTNRCLEFVVSRAHKCSVHSSPAEHGRSAETFVNDVQGYILLFIHAHALIGRVPPVKEWSKSR